MKKSFALFGFVLFISLLTGCFVRSLHPLYTEKDLIFDENLLGIWQDENTNKWEFTKEDKGYQLTHTDERGNKAIFEARLLKLEKYRFLDLYVVGFDDGFDQKLNGFGLFHLIPAHTFMRVDSIDKQEAKFRFFNLNWLKKIVKQNPKTIEHIFIGEKEDPDVVLTATTAQLQSFVLKNAEGEAFENEFMLKKIEDSKR
ncbi:MAG: hypothetical protein ACP5MG_02875 [Verrucomicrobiia bacterium]